MAVSRVIGTVDGVEVIFAQKEGDRWEVPVPADEDGEYVVEIMAEDEAGNRAYMAKMLFMVNRALLCTHVKPFPYYAVLAGEQFEVALQPPRFRVSIIEPECEGIQDAENDF